jgi:hypothetical protein
MGGMSGEDGGVVVTGHEFGDFDLSTAEVLLQLRSAAEDYYNDNIRGTRVEHPDERIKEVLFSSRGRKKAISSSANPDKLKVFAKLPELMKNSEVIGSEEVKNIEKHPGVVRFWRLKANAVLDGRLVSVGFLVEERKNGKIYYNHNLETETGPSSGISGESPKGTLPPSADEPIDESISDSGDNASANEKTSTPIRELESDNQALKYTASAEVDEENITQNEDYLNLNIETAASRSREGGFFNGQDQSGEGDVKRGSTAFGRDAAVITLFESADLSTLLHELGHFFLQDVRDTAASEGAATGAKDLWEGVAGWQGVDDIDLGKPLSEEDAKKFIDALSKQDWDFVQGAWDLLEGDLRPLVREVMEKMTGVSPEWVEAAPVVTKHGTYRGGYYPILRAAPDFFAAELDRPPNK